MERSAIVMNFGGALAHDAAQLERLLQQLAGCRDATPPLVLVHGGGRQIRELGQRFGLVERFHQGLRITDAAALEIVQLGLSQVNRTIVQAAAAAGISAVGISGVDASAFVARRRAVGADGVDYGYVGEVYRGNPRLLLTLLQAGFLPVVACLAKGETEPALNVNADEMAAAVAVSMNAATLIFFTDVAGVLDASGSVMARLTLADVQRLRADGVVSGGMLPKLRACQTALEAGVKQVRIVGYHTSGALQAALAGEAIGTLLVRS